MSGGVQYDARWQDVSASIYVATGKTVTQVTEACRRKIVGNITQQGLVDTGNYRDSWQTQSQSTEGIVGSDVEYGVYLEYGHSARRSGKFEGPPKWIPAKPHVVPAAQAVVDRLYDIVKEAFR